MAEPTFEPRNSYEMLVEDAHGLDYERATVAESYFGISKTDALLLMILKRLDDLREVSR